MREDNERRRGGVGSHAGDAFAEGKCFPDDPMKALGERLLADVPAIVDGWVRRASAAESWLKLPPQRGITTAPLDDLVRGLLDSALCRPAELSTHRRAVRAAAKHGQVRREQGASEVILFVEFTFLRQELWARVRAVDDVPEVAALTAIAALDLGISVATQAALRGYYRPEAEREGRWPKIITQVAEESPLLVRAERRGVEL